MTQIYKIKRDKYKQARGGYSRLLDICCRKCGKPVVVYQKDGSGNLRRLYLDRIFNPENLTNLQNKAVEDIKSLKCFHCNEILGMPYTYQKERRKAFRLFQDAVIKRIIKF